MYLNWSDEIRIFYEQIAFAPQPFKLIPVVRRRVHVASKVALGVGDLLAELLPTASD